MIRTKSWLLACAAPILLAASATAAPPAPPLGAFGFDIADMDKTVAPVVDGFTGDQRVFLGWAQNYRSKAREASPRRQVLTDVHSPGLHLEPAARVRV